MTAREISILAQTINTTVQAVKVTQDGALLSKLDYTATICTMNTLLPFNLESLFPGLRLPSYQKPLAHAAQSNKV